jgi:pyruvate dehydrogenase E2 component (dihydrolipoamide acetyltransferase)
VSVTYREAVREAIAEALRADERVFLMGEDVGAYGGSFGVSLGLLEEFGPERIRDTPLSESTFVGAGIGAALNGMRPIVVSLRGGGLVAPAIHHADQRDLADLMAALKDLVARTRAGRLRGGELSDPTITVSNLGDQGAESILGVIYPPQVALVGFGRITDRPWAVDGLIEVRPTVAVSLSADHRATDGATGGRYLQTITHLLHRPEEL